MIIKTANSTYTLKPIKKDPQGRYTLTSTNPRYPGPYEVDYWGASVGRNALFQFNPRRPEFKGYLVTSKVESIK